MTRTVGSGNDISIHSLRMEGDIKETPKTSMKSFQSTPSAWRETIGVVETVTPIWDFNPLPPHGGRRTFLLMLLLHRTFQSTPSAWRETDDGFVYALTGKIFQSTPSAWRETLYS